jgi:hypothetical protein
MPVFGIGTGRGLLYSPPVVAAATYTGPGDVVGSAFSWWGLRGYNAAYATGSNPAIDIVDQAGANPLTVNILSNGRLDVASINAWVTANSVTTIKVTKLYDQVSTRHLIMATLANMPTLNLTGIGSLPAISFTAANSHRLVTSATNYNLAQPFTMSAVLRSSSDSTGREIFGFSNKPLLFHNTSNTLSLQAPTTSSANVTVSDGSWHAFQGVWDSTSSALYNDGSGTTGLTTSGDATNKQIFLGGPPAFSNYFNDSIAEWGVWPLAFNSTQAGDMNTNQHGSNGHNF